MLLLSTFKFTCGLILKFDDFLVLVFVLLLFFNFAYYEITQFLLNPEFSEGFLVQISSSVKSAFINS